MKKIFYVSFLIFLFLFPTGCFDGKGGAASHPGFEVYEPTKLEWFILRLNSTYRQPYNGSYSLTFVEKYPDTVIIYIRYRPQARALLKSKIKDTRETVASLAKARKWKWLKIEVKTSALP